MINKLLAIIGGDELDLELVIVSAEEMKKMTGEEVVRLLKCFV